MDKREKELEFIYKMAQKHGVDYQTALQYAIVKEYIEYVEKNTEIIAE